MKRKTVISSASAIEPFLYFCWESFACTLNPFRQKDANAQKKQKFDPVNNSCFVWKFFWLVVSFLV